MYTIVTLASHSSLQILKGAKDEGFRTLAISLAKNSPFYKRFPFIDEIISVTDYKQFYTLSESLRKLNPIVVPHGSFVAYLGSDGDNRIRLPYFGSKKILEIEADRNRQLSWLADAGIKLPKIFADPADVDRKVIIKTHGARGGSGYFLAKGKADLQKKVSKLGLSADGYIIQEYITGIPVYLQYFYSPLDKSIELMGIDRRYESDVDGIGRIPLSLQKDMKNNVTYTVIGNFPIVLRESLLPKVYAMGQAIVDKSVDLSPPLGLYGPFCLETIVTPDQEFFAIEISCRIVAGTNLYISGSPYTDLLYDVPMSTGRRIALEIKRGIQKNNLNLLLT